MLVANKSMSVFFKTSDYNLNVQGNGVPSTNRSTPYNKLSECSLTGQLPNVQCSTTSKKTCLRNDKRELLPSLYQQWKKRQRSDNISDIRLCPSSTVPHQTSAFNCCHSSAAFLLPVHQKQITIPAARVNTLHMVLDGKKMEMEERFNLMQEIRHLKRLVLPDHACNLFHGKSFHLSQSHESLKPRGKMLLEEGKELLQSPTKPPLRKTNGTEIKSNRQPSSNSLTPQEGRSDTLIEFQRNKDDDMSLAEDINGDLMNKKSSSISTPDKSKTFLSVDIKDDPEVETKQSTASVSPDQQILPETGHGNEAIPEAGSETVTTQQQQQQQDHQEQQQQQQYQHQEEHQDQQQSDISMSWTLTDLVDVNSAEQDVLKKTFNRLDTDKDGHILYTQLKSQLPDKFSTSQEKFIKLVYDITSQNTFFGLMEFVAMTQLTKALEELSDTASDAFNLLNFTHLQHDILEYFTKFQSADCDYKGSISLDSLNNLISAELGSGHQMEPSTWNNILEHISLTDAGAMKKTNFLAHLPYFLSLKNKT